jgi:hypothetical protein
VEQKDQSEPQRPDLPILGGLAGNGIPPKKGKTPGFLPISLIPKQLTPIDGP